jgi:ACT domain-containing protein
MLIDGGIYGDRNVVKKDAEKILKYKDFIMDIQRMWNVRAKVIQVTIGATGTISKVIQVAIWATGTISKVIPVSTGATGTISKLIPVTIGRLELSQK